MALVVGMMAVVEMTRVVEMTMVVGMLLLVFLGGEKYAFGQPPTTDSESIWTSSATAADCSGVPPFSLTPGYTVQPEPVLSIAPTFGGDPQSDIDTITLYNRNREPKSSVNFGSLAPTPATTVDPAVSLLPPTAQKTQGGQKYTFSGCFQQFFPNVADTGTSPRQEFLPEATAGVAIAGAFRNELALYWCDVKHLYTFNNLGNYMVAIGGTGILANTSLDQRFIDWYQADVRSSGTDSAAKFWKMFGEGQYTIPILVGSSLLYGYLQQQIPISPRNNQSLFGDFLSRSARATVIGLPPLVIGQSVLGAGRPQGPGIKNSNWQPFENANAISGHAYLGSIPFITLAQMTDRIWAKSIFYFGSTLTGWSRINDDDHYLSQVILGWYLGYLSCRAVTETEAGPLPRGLNIFPLVSPDSTRIGLTWQF